MIDRSKMKMNRLDDRKIHKISEERLKQLEEARNAKKRLENHKRRVWWIWFISFVLLSIGCISSCSYVSYSDNKTIDLNFDLSNVCKAMNANFKESFNARHKFVSDSIYKENKPYLDSTYKAHFLANNQVRKYKSRKAHYENQEYGYYGYPWVCETRWGERTCHREKTWYTTGYRYEFAWWDTTWTEGFKTQKEMDSAMVKFVNNQSHLEATRRAEKENGVVRGDTVMLDSMNQNTESWIKTFPVVIPHKYELIRDSEEWPVVKNILSILGLISMGIITWMVAIRLEGEAIGCAVVLTIGYVVIMIGLLPV